MSESQPEPNWDALPYNPIEFFELGRDFDRKDLKRAYNRLIRVYKPEKSPAQFQLIRAAFEELDSDLRYGQPHLIPSAPLGVQFDWTGPDESSARPSESEDSRESRTRPQPSFEFDANAGPRPQRRKRTVVPHQELAKRLESESPKQVYADLSEKEDKTPWDFFALALLSDTLEPHDEMKFFKWLLAGLRKHPGESGLLSLLYNVYREPQLLDLIPKLLLATAKVIRTDRFYALTEPMWDDYLRNAPFHEFRDTLERCESELRDFRIEGRVAFYIYLLKPALWLGDEDWVADAFDLINEHSNDRSFQFDFEVELLHAIDQYIRYRDEFLNGSGLRREMDRAVEAYCIERPEHCDHLFIQMQVRMASNARAIMDAFPLKTDGTDGPMLMLWSWIAAEVNERQSSIVERDDETGGVRLRKAKSFVTNLEVRTDSSSLGRMWNFVCFSYSLGQLGGIYVLTFIIIYSMTSFGWGLVGAAVIGVPLRYFGMPRLFERYCIWMAIRCYERIWRGEVLQFLRRTRAETGMLVDTIVELQDYEEGTVVGWLPHFVVNDDAIPLFMSTQKYLA